MVMQGDKAAQERITERGRRHLCGLPGVVGVTGAGEAVAQAPTKLHRLLRS